jgi:hypothetical protein
VFGKVVRLMNQKREHDFVGMLIPTLSKNEHDIEKAMKNLKSYRNLWFRPVGDKQYREWVFGFKASLI